MTNSLMVIRPYWHEGFWVFDDEATGLVREPFVEGIPVMIDQMIADIPDARSGFRLLFGATPFPSAQIELEWVREELGGNWYRNVRTGEEGWLCPALFLYFETAPPKLYARADPRADR